MENRLVSDTIELYREKSTRPFLTIKSSFQPTGGDILNIEGRAYEVIARSFTVDRAGKPDQSIRCNLIVTEST